jgi:hypothetical protein
MKVRHLFLIGLLLCVAGLCGCSDSDSDHSISGDTEASSVSGVVMDGYLGNVFVFLDMDADMEWDEGSEPHASTDSEGRYTIKAAVDAADYPVVAIVGTDATDADGPVKNAYVMYTPKGQTLISPLTTLVAAHLHKYPERSAEDAEFIIKSLLNLSDTSLFEDYIAKENKENSGEEDGTEGAMLHRIARTLAHSFGEYLAAAEDASPGTEKSILVLVAAEESMGLLEEISAQVQEQGDTYDSERYVASIDFDAFIQDLENKINIAASYTETPVDTPYEVMTTGSYRFEIPDPDSSGFFDFPSYEVMRLDAGTAALTVQERSFFHYASAEEGSDGWLDVRGGLEWGLSQDGTWEQYVKFAPGTCTVTQNADGSVRVTSRDGLYDYTLLVNEEDVSDQSATDFILPFRDSDGNEIPAPDFPAGSRLYTWMYKQHVDEYVLWDHLKDPTLPFHVRVDWLSDSPMPSSISELADFYAQGSSSELYLGIDSPYFLKFNASEQTVYVNQYVSDDLDPIPVGEGTYTLETRNNCDMLVLNLPLEVKEAIDVEGSLFFADYATDHVTMGEIRKAGSARKSHGLNRTAFEPVYAYYPENIPPLDYVEVDVNSVNNFNELTIFDPTPSKYYISFQVFKDNTQAFEVKAGPRGEEILDGSGSILQQGILEVSNLKDTSLYYNEGVRSWKFYLFDELDEYRQYLCFILLLDEDGDVVKSVAGSLGYPPG